MKTSIPPVQGTEGPYKGHAPANVPWDIFIACTEGDAINVNTWVALNTTITLPGLYDLIEMQEAQKSWNQAALANLALAKDGQDS